MKYYDQILGIFGQQGGLAAPREARPFTGRQGDSQGFQVAHRETRSLRGWAGPLTRRKGLSEGGQVGVTICHFVVFFNTFLSDLFVCGSGISELFRLMLLIRRNVYPI